VLSEAHCQACPSHLHRSPDDFAEQVGDIELDVELDKIYQGQELEEDKAVTEPHRAHKANL
jgi:hypothetical protein